MAKKGEQMGCVATMWSTIALEYARFLLRHNLETICVLSKRIFLGYEMQVFTNLDKYNDLRKDKNFREEEKQIVGLLLEIQDLNDEIESYYEAEEDSEENDYVDNQNDEDEYF